MAKTKQKKQHAPAKTPAGRFFQRLGVILGTLLLICVTTCAILACYGAIYVQNVIMPEVEKSSINMVTSETDLSSAIYYYDHSSGSYAAAQTLYASENRVWVSLEDIPQNLIDATVSIEDKRFWTHKGVDWRRTAAAVKYMFTGQRIQGGSTITQQLIKNLTGNDETTVRRKVLEIFEALEFDRNHTKEETIEWYLNAIYLGHGCYGVSTATEKYFGKQVSELTLAECASLISITNNPSKYDPYSQPDNNLQRRNLVLDLMCEQGYISESQRDSAKAEKLNCVYGSDTGNSETLGSDSEYYSWYTDAVIEQVIADLEDQYGYDETTATNLIYSGGLQIFSCLNPDVQKQVDAVYTDSANFAQYASRRGQALRSGITVVDNATGAVVALAGGAGEKVGNRIWNCATDTLRPPGSSIKPIGVYAPAIEEDLVLPSSAEDDTPFMENSDGTLWTVSSEGYYSGLTDVDHAVTESLNTVAVKVLDTLGLQNSYNYLTEKFGISTLVTNYETSTGAVKSDLNYAPLALGGLTKGISTLEMASAYAAFPRNGVYTHPYLYTVVTDSNGKVILSNGDYDVAFDDNKQATITGQASSKTILSERTTFYMNSMLQNVVTSGTGTSARLSGMTAAGKTGTTTDDYDRWFVGYTPYYTAAVWTGYDSQETINAAVNPACVLWQKVMSSVSQGAEDTGFQSTLQTVQCSYCSSSGKLATAACRAAGCAKTGTFVVGDEPTTYCDRHYYDSKGNMILNYSRTGAAAKARISGEVSFIRKKPVKKKEPPKKADTEKTDEETAETGEEATDHEEQTEEDSPKDDEQQDEKPKDETETGGDTPETEETE